MTGTAPTREWARPGPAAHLLKRWGNLAPVLVFLAVMMLYPVGQLLLLSFQTPAGDPTLGHYARLFAADVYVRVLLITLKISAWTTLISVVFGYPIAYLIATSGERIKTQLMFWVLLPFWTSFLVRTFAWLVLLGRNGLINQMLQGLWLTGAPAELLYNLTAVLIGMSHALMPLCILTMVSVMENIDPSLSKAGLTLGARPGSTFWRIYFPLSLAGVTAAGLLVFISALGFFITPAFLGGRFETMITQIIIEQVQELLNWPFAGAISLMLLAAALAVFYLYDRLLGLSTLAGGGGAADRPPSRLSGALGRIGLHICGALGWASDAVTIALERIVPRRAGRPRLRFGRVLHWVVALALLVFLCLPAFIMIPVSFTSASVIDWPPRGFALTWYESFWNSPLWMQATARSFIVATGAAVLAMLIGTPAAFALTRQPIRGKTALLGFMLSPLIIPRMIIAVALFYLYSRIGLVGTYSGLILGHAVLAVPYVVVTVMAVLKNYDERYDRAAWNLGAGRIRTLYHVTLPLIRAGLISAFLFAFITSFDELTIALFVTGGLTTTLPKQMWDDAILRVTPTLAAASTLLLVFVTVLIVVADRLQRRGARG